jgi:integrase
MENDFEDFKKKIPWNKGVVVGQKRPLTRIQVWQIRIRLELQQSIREIALLNLGLDSKLRSCDLLKLKVKDIMHGSTVLSRAMVLQQKTQKTVQFEITKATRASIVSWVGLKKLHPQDYLFSGVKGSATHLSSRQYARIVKSWVRSIGLDEVDYGTHSIRRTKATLIYRQTKNIRAIQLLLGHTKLESTIRYLGIEVDDALEISEDIEL